MVTPGPRTGRPARFKKGEPEMLTRIQWSVATAIAAALCASTAVAKPAEAQRNSGKTTSLPVTQLQEVIVEAMKIKARVIDLPVSITTFDAKQLKNLNILDVNKLAYYTPGLEIQPSQSGGAGIVLRGVTTTVGGIGVDPSVGFYEDGVYISREWAVLQSYLDVGNAEVLRGPQGTLYGRNTTGGAYLITHTLPTPKPEIGASAEVTGYQSGGLSQSYQGYISGALIGDAVLGRLAVSRDKDIDYTKNLYTGYRPASDQTSAIATLQIHPNQDLNIILRADIANQRGRVGSNYHVIQLGPYNAAANVPPDPYEYRADYPGTANYLHNRGVSLNVHWHFGDGYELKSITGARTILINTQYDSDGTELPIYTALENDQSRTFSQEFDLLSPQGQRLSWVGGLYFYRESAHDLTTSGGPYSYGPFYITDPSGNYLYSGATGQYLTTSIPFDYLGVFNDSNLTKSYAAFGQVSFEFTPKLKGTLGVRFTDEKRTFTGLAGTTFLGEGASGVFTFDPTTACQDLVAANPVSSPAGLSAAQAAGYCVSDLDSDEATYNATSLENRSPTSLTFHNVSWRTALDYHVTADTMLYATVATGFKSGGFNSYDTDAAYSGSKPGQPGVPVVAYQPPFGPERLISYEVGVKGAAFDHRVMYQFDYWYYDWSNIQAQLYNYVTTSSDITNDAKAKAQGPELDVKARPWSGALVNFDAAEIDSRYTHFGVNFSDQITGADNVNFTGSAIPSAPKWKSNLGIQQTVALAQWGGFTPRAEYLHQSSTYSTYTYDPLAKAGGYDIYNFRLMYQNESGDFEAALFVENLTNRYYDYYRTGTDTTGIIGVVAPPRTFGIRLSVKLEP